MPALLTCCLILLPNCEESCARYLRIRPSNRPHTVAPVYALGPVPAPTPSSTEPPGSSWARDGPLPRNEYRDANQDRLPLHGRTPSRARRSLVVWEGNHRRSGSITP